MKNVTCSVLKLWSRNGFVRVSRTEGWGQGSPVLGLPLSCSNLATVLTQPQCSYRRRGTWPECSWPCAPQLGWDHPHFPCTAPSPQELGRAVPTEVPRRQCWSQMLRSLEAKLPPSLFGKGLQTPRPPQACPPEGFRGSRCCLQGPESGPHLARAGHSCPAQAPRGGSRQRKAAVAVRGRPPQLWEGGAKGRAGCLQKQSLPAARSSQESRGQGLPTVRRGWRPKLMKNFQNSTVRKQPQFFTNGQKI